MPNKIITRACGHDEEVWLLEDEMNNRDSIRHHQEYECLECYLQHNSVKEVRMDYKSYKIEYTNCRTKPNSYDKQTKKITVYVPTMNTEL